MTQPEIRTSKPVSREAYVQVQAGAYKATPGSVNPNIGVKLGGEISKGGTYAKAEVGCGTALQASLEAGHEFTLSRNIGLELAGKGEYLRNFSDSSFTSNFNTQTSFSDTDGNNYAYETYQAQQHNWKDGYKKLGASCLVNFKGRRGNIKVGLEGGYRANLAPDITHHYDVNATNPTTNETKHYEGSMMYKGRESGGYITPKVSAELNLNKKGTWSLVADADRFQGNAGIRFTF